MNGNTLFDEPSMDPKGKRKKKLKKIMQGNLKYQYFWITNNDIFILFTDIMNGQFQENLITYSFRCEKELALPP